MGENPWGIAINPTTNRIYVTNLTGESITELRRQTLVESLSGLGRGPLPAAGDTVRNVIYVTNFVGSCPPPVSSSGCLYVIYGGTFRLIWTIPAASGAQAIAVDEIRNRVFVVHFGQVEIFSGITTGSGGGNITPLTVPVGNGSAHIAVDPATGSAYISNSSDNSVSVIFRDNTTANVPVGTEPGAIAVNAATNRIYVVNTGSNNMTVIDGDTLATTTVPLTLNGARDPEQLVVNPETNRIYVANTTANVTVIQGDTLATTVVPVAGRPTALAVNPRTNFVYAATVSNMVTAIDGQTNNTSSVEVGVGPVAVAVDPNTNLVYTANYPANSVTIFEGLGREDNTPWIRWPEFDHHITVGTPLSDTQLNAQAFSPLGAPLTGTFVYSPPAGTVLPPGAHTLSVTFTPSDPSFIQASGSTTIEVLDTATDFNFIHDTIAKTNGVGLVGAYPNETTISVKLKAMSVGPKPFDRRITFICRTDPDFQRVWYQRVNDVPEYVSCDSPVADFRGNTDPNATQEVTLHIFTDGRGTAIAMSRAQRIGGWTIALMLPIVGILLTASPRRRDKRRFVLPLSLLLMLVILAPGCGTRYSDQFRIRIQGIAEGGTPVHFVPVNVSTFPPN